MLSGFRYTFKALYVFQPDSAARWAPCQPCLFICMSGQISLGQSPKMLRQTMFRSQCSQVVSKLNRVRKRCFKVERLKRERLDGENIPLENQCRIIWHGYCSIYSQLLIVLVLWMKTFALALTFCTALLASHPAFSHSDAGAFGDGTAGGHSDSHDHQAEERSLQPGVVTINPRAVTNIVIRINARVRSLRNLYVGKRVNKGEVLGELESAELETVQKTYLSIITNLDAVEAFSMTANEKLIDGRMNLAWRGMSEQDIKRLEDTREPLKLVAIRAPVSGYLLSVNAVSDQILNAGVQSGQYSASGVMIASIAKPDAIAVEASVPLEMAATLRPRQKAVVFIPGGAGGRVAVAGEVQHVFAFVNPNTQRRTVRLNLAAIPGGVMPVNGQVVTVSFTEAEHAH